MRLRVPSGVLMARVRFYWPDVWRDPSYRTADGVIPFPLFWLYAANLSGALAFARVQETRAVACAIGLAFTKKGEGLPESLRADLVDAFLAPKE
jgi:hypothetical protein